MEGVERSIRLVAVMLQFRKLWCEKIAIFFSSVSRVYDIIYDEAQTWLGIRRVLIKKRRDRLHPAEFLARRNLLPCSLSRGQSRRSQAASRKFAAPYPRRLIFSRGSINSTRRRYFERGSEGERLHVHGRTAIINNV